MKTFVIFLSLLTISFISLGNLLHSPPDSIGVKKINNQDYILYLVEQGETYTTIAAKYGLSESEIKKANPGIPNPNVNQVVLVPIIIKRLYTVQKGDYIYKVARDFKMDVKRLKELNQLESDVLKEGQNLIVEVPLHALQTQNSQPNQPAAGAVGTGVVENQYNQPASEATIDYTQPAGENATIPANPNYNQVAGENPAGNNFNQPAGTLPAAGAVAVDPALGGTASPASTGWVTKEPKVHKVAQGEYIFALAREKNISVDSIKTWNSIESEGNIHPGQDLIVGYNYYDSNGNIVNTSGANIPDVKGNTMGALPDANVSANAANPAQMAGLSADVNMNLPTYKKETGYGKMIKDNTGQAPQQNVALHKSAPYGTYIKVVNPGNGKTVAVKIIGQIPQEMAADPNLLILLSPTACNKIGVINEAFPIQLEYNQ